ncbi:MAG: peptide deformylase [Candidatus Omnitrophica bacterium]|nr:peptide deformylase [Candidatus Omnitrophota bacterium]
MPHETLRTVAEPIRRLTDDVHRLVDDLIETMHAHDGVGLAASQVGCSVQAFVANPTRQRGDELVVLNPVLESQSGHAVMVEGCLSLPEVWEEVPRWASVRLRGLDASGRPLDVKATGLLAIVIQHELDHLKGRLLIDARAETNGTRSTGRRSPKVARHYAERR